MATCGMGGIDAAVDAASSAPKPLSVARFFRSVATCGKRGIDAAVDAASIAPLPQSVAWFF